MPVEFYQKKDLATILLSVLEHRLTKGFPFGSRGEKLVTVADFSGTHRDSQFVTYAFLTLDLDQNLGWLNGQSEFRQRLGVERRISFKSLNDAVRRKALIPFLKLANGINGALTVAIVPKSFGPLTESNSSELNDLLRLWKPKVHEHLLRVTHLGGLITAFMSRPNQNLLFITDQDEIASNDAQLTQLSEIMMRVLGNCLDHDMGHLIVGTTKSDDGSLALEDLTAIADLAAGGAWELLSSTASAGWTPVKGIVTPFPRSISKKAQILGCWLAHRQSSLQRSLLLFSKDANKGSYMIRSLEIEPIHGAIQLG